MTQSIYKRMGISIAVAALCTLPFQAWAERYHFSKTVSVVYGPDHRDCTFFTLDGVTEADGVTPNSEWFAVPKTHSGYKEIVAMLLMARANGAPLQHVRTTGAVVCGLAEVWSVSL